MDPWTLGLVAVVVVGLVVIVFGALFDRSRNKRAALAMMSPPQRVIPQFQPDATSPAYLSELQARRAPPDSVSTELTHQERAEISEQLKDPSQLVINSGFASRDFVTDPDSQWAVLEDPRVLVCADPVASIRELLTILEKLILSRTPLVIMAPTLAPEVQATLEVNTIRQTMRLLVVKTSGADLQRAASATGAEVRTRSDLQAGYVRPEHLGSCARWVSTARVSLIIGAAGPSGGGIA